MTQEPTSPASAGIPSWFPVVGVILGAVTLTFLMGLVALSTAGKEVPCDSRFLVASVLALGAALASSFLGGSAAAQGAIPLPFAKNHPLQLSMAGGIAVLVIVLIVGTRLYVPAGGCAAATPAIETTAAYRLVADLNKLEPARTKIARLQQYLSAYNIEFSVPESAAIEEPGVTVDARMLGRYAVIIVSSFDAAQPAALLAFVDTWSNRVALWDADFGGAIHPRFVEWGPGVSPNAIVEVTYPTIRGSGTYGESTKIYTVSDDYVLLSLDKPSFEYNSGWGAFQGDVEFKTENIFQVDPAAKTYQIRTIGAASVITSDSAHPGVLRETEDGTFIIAWRALPDEFYIWNRLSRQFDQKEGRIVAGQNLMTSIYSDYATPIGDWFKKPGQLQTNSTLDLLYGRR
jgi:hypothetical protein